MPTTTIHVIAPFHTIPTLGASHCAFTQKALRFSKMMHLVKNDDGANKYRIIEYANEGSASEADEHVTMLTREEYDAFYKPETTSPGAQAAIGTPAYDLFNRRLEQAIMERAKRNDIVSYVFGPCAHAELVGKFPGLVHVETGIGYPWQPMGAYPIFESEAWRNYQWGRYGNPGGVIDGKGFTASKTWCIPNYFDSDDWPATLEPSNAVGFMSRFVYDKGIHTLTKIIKAWHSKHPTDGMKFVLAGMGDFAGWLAASDFTPGQAWRIDYRGVVTGGDRAKLLGSCKAFLLPTVFVEPFGGAAVEAMLCGTPALTANLGAFPETVLPETGSLCRTVDDYVTGIERAATMDRVEVARETRRRYSLEAVAPQFDQAFQQLLSRPGIE